MYIHMNDRKLKRLLDDLSIQITENSTDPCRMQAWLAGLDADHASAIGPIAAACRVAIADEPSPSMMPDCSARQTNMLFEFVDAMTPETRAAVAALQV